MSIDTKLDIVCQLSGIAYKASVYWSLFSLQLQHKKTDKNHNNHERLLASGTPAVQTSSEEFQDLNL